uniref:Uncharacterized protein n=1 Tax=Panagrolaimus sp. PS1159 TaxID=55785 RepID=A0AC35F2D6_9BILA
MYKGDSYTKQVFVYYEGLIGAFADSHSMAFEFLPDGTLINNGSNADPKHFPLSGAEVQEADGKRHFDFKVTWENEVYGEFMIPLSQFAVEVPPTTTTSTTTPSTTTETITTTTTPKKLITENTKSSTKKEPVAEASISGTSD